MDEKKEQSYSGEKKDSQPVKVSTHKEKKVTVTFRENRKFDLHIGRNIVTFKGKESKPIPASWLEHKDWGNVSKYFIIKGV